MSCLKPKEASWGQRCFQQNNWIWKKWTAGGKILAVFMKVLKKRNKDGSILRCRRSYHKDCEYLWFLRQSNQHLCVQVQWSGICSQRDSDRTGNWHAVQKKQRAVKRQSIIIRMTRSETGLLMRRLKMVSAKQNIITSITIPTNSSSGPMQRSGAIREQPTAMMKMAIWFRNAIRQTVQIRLLMNTQQRIV